MMRVLGHGLDLADAASKKVVTAGLNVNAMPSAKEDIMHFKEMSLFLTAVLSFAARLPLTIFCAEIKVYEFLLKRSAMLVYPESMLGWRHYENGNAFFD